MLEWNKRVWSHAGGATTSRTRLHHERVKGTIDDTRNDIFSDVQCISSVCLQVRKQLNLILWGYIYAHLGSWIAWMAEIAECNGGRFACQIRPDQLEALATLLGSH